MKTDKTTTKQDKEIKDRKGSQPAKYYGKDAEGDDMAKSTKQARARHFEKGTKKDDDDPSAYKPAPGDKSAKTKPSKHTLKYKKMFGERTKQAVAGGKVQKLVTGFGLKYKGKTYKEIDMELKRVDNVSQMVTFNIIHPKEIFGNEIKLPFKTIRRGPFMATDTSKINEERKMSFTNFYKDKKMDEGKADVSLKKKSEESDISFSILKKVYNRGVAAWRTGHRPGTTPEQWGHARVNSFITGGKTRTTGDADLWKQHKGVKEEVIMKTFRNYLTEGMGDCFESAGIMMITPEQELQPQFHKFAEKNLVLVHGLVYGQGPLEGRRFAHAWCEIANIVLDNSNGKKRIVPKEKYYAIGKINEKERGAFKRYTRYQASEQFVKTKHYGPWHLNEKLEEEDLPDTKREIGKKKLRIPTQLLKSID